MPFDALCLICNEWFSERKSDHFNTLWTDDLMVGRPICWSCTMTFKIAPVNLNYAPHGYKRKKRGLDRWL